MWGDDGSRKNIISPPQTLICLTLHAVCGYEFSHISAVWKQPDRDELHLSRDAEFSLLFTRSRRSRIHT